jgi:adenylosuccinate lyase
LQKKGFLDMNTLTALSPLDGRYSEKLNNLRPIFSEFGLIKCRVIIEIRWLAFLANQQVFDELPALTHEANTFLDTLINHFNTEHAARIKSIEATINHDVKAIEYFLKEQFATHAELLKVCEFIHFGCTSEDINNLAYGLMLHTARQTVLVPELERLIKEMQTLAHEHAQLPMLARTHGQAATPTTVGKELANVVYRLRKQLAQLNDVAICGKLNGATGNYSALRAAKIDCDWATLSKQFIESLSLNWNEYTTQIEPHDYIAELAMCLIRINTILIDFNRDMWGYISLDYFKLKNINHEVGSSTMPHKINPIDFENAEGNLGLANAVLEFMATKLPISRWQRDLSDSTVLRNLGVAVGYAMLAYSSTLKGLQKTSPNLTKLAADLDDHWEVLAEPIQTIMRRYGIEQPYEKLKTFTRGKKMDKQLIHDFIADLALPDAIKNQLYQLSPSNYLGYAAELAANI